MLHGGKEGGKDGNGSHPALNLGKVVGTATEAKRRR